MSLIIQNFVLSWYSSISVDDGFVFELKSLVRHILANLIIRLKKVITPLLNNIQYLLFIS
jgi:hypothetical protein